MNHHHNTTGETGARAERFEREALKQDERILGWFLKYDRPEGWTPSEVHRLWLPNVPITSVRRAMSNLTKAQELVKLETKRRGPFGRPEHAWKLAEPSKQGELI